MLLASVAYLVETIEFCAWIASFGTATGNVWVRSVDVLCAAIAAAFAYGELEGSG